MQLDVYVEEEKEQEQEEVEEEEEEEGWDCFQMNSQTRNFDICR